jgi:hypothetical protein
MKKVYAFFEENWQVLLLAALWFGGFGFIAYKLGI